MRYVIAKDGAKWRVYDNCRKEFAEPFTSASSKADARERAATKNAEYELAVANGFVKEVK